MAWRGRRGRRRWIVIAAVVVLLLAATSVARFYTDVLWFGEIGLQSVLWKSITTQLLLGLIVGGVVAALVWLNVWVAGRIGLVDRTPRFEVVGREDPMERYRESIAPYAGWIRLGAALFLGFVTGVGASASWRTFLLWTNRVSVGASDPQFDRDIGFYLFELPFFDRVLSWVWFALLASLVLTIAAHYFYGSIRPEAGLSGIGSAALGHVSVLLGLLALVRAAQYYLGRFQLNFSSRGTVTGASYTDVNAQLPALHLLIIISIISALLFFATVWVRRFVLPAAAVAIWLLVVVLAGGVWPWAIQRFSVAPQEPVRERPFIERNIAATREAFGLTGVETMDYEANAELTAEDLGASDAVLQNVRLWDPEILQQAYLQLQALQPYYEFFDVDIDRYEIDGEMRQVLVSPRELALTDLPPSSQTWSNQHLQYTHGYGIVASLANETTSAGQPDFLVKNLPGDVAEGADAFADLERAGLYYGEGFEPSDYSIVDSGQPELDYPTGTGSQRSSYEGEGGVPVGGMLRRVAFALREGDPNIVLSSLIQNDSRILIYRDVRDRVLRTAPFLSLDHDPYLAAVDGRLVWILDAYTSTPWYPYSQRFDASQIVGSEEEGALQGNLNYIRNSVKVVVDAYDGTMDFFIVDDDDPLVRAWANAFPDLFASEEPSEDLVAHFRYPEDLFKLQSEVYLTYHVTDPQTFYGGNAAWSIPRNALRQDVATLDFEPEVQPRYLLFQLPDEEQQEFALTRPFTPRNRNTMVGFLVARSDPEHYGEVINLRFPDFRQVAGPIQIDNLINQDPEISETLTLLGQRGSNIDFGSLVILPIEESLMYIQPIFVTAEDGGIPELKRVAVVFGEEVVFEESFDAALQSLFDLQPTEPEVPEPPTDGDGAAPTPGEQRELEAIVAEADRLYERAQRALEDGDLATYGRLVERLGRLLERANSLPQ